jgi:hypothetical protein
MMSRMSNSYFFLIGVFVFLLFSTVFVAEAKKPSQLKTVQLAPSDASNYRWRDCHGNPYDPNYMASYDYSQAAVTVRFKGADSTFHGTLEAQNLKPNFAYQLKIEGYSGTESNEKIGLAGRWWQETWNGIEWSNGQNLNAKGDGSSPNPNDEVYYNTKDIPDTTSPTGLKYRYTGYLVFDYFITDSNGAASLEFVVDSSYHVLWRINQRSETSDDGPIKPYSFTPQQSQLAYDTDYGLSEGGVFGEWERLPVGGVLLSKGRYECKIFLTEESFHGSDGPNSGLWAAAMEGHIEFQIKSGSSKGPHKLHPKK